MTAMTRGPARRLTDPNKISRITVKLEMDSHIQFLREGNKIAYRPYGHSMSGLIESGDLVFIEPYTSQTLKIGDIVLCNVEGHNYLHKILQIRPTDGRVQIGNNKGRINGWTNVIYGVCTHINGIART